MTKTARRKALVTLDPRTKLWLLMVIGLVALVGYRGPILAVRPFFILVPFILIALSGQLGAALKLGIVYYFAAYWETLLFFLPQGFWTSILRFGMAIIASFFPCFVMGMYAVRTTTVSEFIAAMQRMRLSEKIIIPFVVLFRFFPTIAEEYRAIQDAMRLRGIGFSRGPVAMLEYRLVPLMISIVKIGDDLSAAATTRGLGGEEKRTNLCQIGFGPLDILLLAAGAVVLGISFWGLML